MNRCPDQVVSLKRDPQQDCPTPPPIPEIFTCLIRFEAPERNSTSLGLTFSKTDDGTTISSSFHFPSVPLQKALSGSGLLKRNHSSHLPLIKIC
ncbi:hypothetical protein TNCV_2689821 [Trichonephila clavipes]|uniref:Uncharacterized protein n=1 Tax=Trichonephila clavipes TaxID=2585209 RepID=A0A8X6VYS4_TRICX|nr:hypothetical protein TNCV_2689821 [Trichonephila clavipes]